eukprot:COSAG06_NODE_7044_length_2659_cov_25.366797_3_plen_240_part_00
MLAEPQAARLEAEAAAASTAAAEAELRAEQSNAALRAHTAAQEEVRRLAATQSKAASTEAEARSELRAEIEGYKAKVARAEEKVGALSELISTKNEIVWALLQQQNELKAENDLHCSNFESYQAQCQQEFAGWIAMNEQLEEEINEYKRADTVRACVRGTLSLHYTPALLCLWLTHGSATGKPSDHQADARRVGAQTAAGRRTVRANRSARAALAAGTSQLMAINAYVRARWPSVGCWL